MKSLLNFAKFLNSVEKYGPMAFSLILTLASILFICNDFIRSIAIRALEFDVLSLIITIESILFGFILTVLALIMQLKNNKALEAIRSANRYTDLIKFNKSAAYSCFFTILFTFILILLSSRVFYSIFYLGFILVWEYTFLMSLFTNLRFMMIFFQIAQKD
ncbi:MAG: hypothetical protein LIO93_04420 [Bacteroidales bacterium]|nr:hypothetical protein [Bacteroidales bacterium]